MRPQSQSRNTECGLLEVAIEDCVGDKGLDLHVRSRVPSDLVHSVLRLGFSFDPASAGL